MPPAISVILPTFNRELFLADAVQSIRSQTCTDWELIVVDDGSTDGTRATLTRLAETIGRPYRYVYQDNRGAYAARNKGLEYASGEFVAYFDSDDRWLPHHLDRCLTAFRHDPGLDWVYAPVQRVDFRSGRVLSENSFFVQGSPRPFLSLHCRTVGDLHIIEDDQSLEVQILHGFYCGLQNSVIRRGLFNDDRFWEQFRVVEDELFFVRALARHARVAYYREPHVIYNVHEQNSSASSSDQSLERSLAIYRELVDGFETIRQTVPMARREVRALRKRLSNEYFWHLGYHGYWRAGQRRQALAAFRQGMALRPLDIRMWKSYIAAVARTYVVANPERAS